MILSKIFFFGNKNLSCKENICEKIQYVDNALIETLKEIL